jgi:hypothetical protein
MYSTTRDLLPVAILFVGALAVSSLDWFFGLKGGVATVGAERVLSGEIPYRDFWTMYAPGHFYLLAFLFHIFGSYILVEAIAGSVVSAAAACLCYLIVFNLVGTKLVALLCAIIFFAAGYNAGYFRWLGTYPPAIFFILTALNFMVLYYKNRQKMWYLFAAGLATGGAVVFKHDIGGYAAVAIVVGLLAYDFLTAVTPGRVRALVLKLAVYSAGFAGIVVPVFTYFVVHGGMDTMRDLFIFPLTDFPFARPERYPSLIPSWIYDPWRLKMLANVFAYVQFGVPVALVLLGLVGTELAFQRRKLDYVALGATFSVAFLLHYVAAHVQINTHIISMSLYAAGLGVIFYDMALRAAASSRGRRAVLTTLAGAMLGTVWFASLAAKPAYSTWRGWSDRKGSVETTLPKLAGINLSPPEARILVELFGYVNALVPKEEKLFVGLHRHDAIIVNDVRMYFLLDRPIAIRYQELHPGIADTKPVQQEIIDDLIRENVKLIILGHFFSNETLEVVKKNRLQNLPQTGAMDLDGFIRENFVAVQKYGDYEIWRRKAKLSS